MSEMRNPIERAVSPEAAGVSSRVIMSFLEESEKQGYEIHSFMVIRHGKVAAECYRAPFTAMRPHAMYSVSKTVTATAIGIAADEGYFTVEDRVRDIFPEYTKNIEDERLDSLLIKHLLTMTSGKEPSVFANKTKGDWIEQYFSSKWYNKPGEEFKYINENIYMLSAIIEKTTGQCMRDFLKDRLFTPLGIDYPFWETDRNGIEAGGWGLYLKTEDLAKIMLLYQNKGIYDGKRILSEEWIASAVKPLADTSAELDNDARYGYGYCIWRCAKFRGYRADGMFSQYAVVFEDYDAVVVVTAAEALAQRCRDFIWEFFPKAFTDFDEGNDTSYEGLSERLASAVLEKPSSSSDSSAMERIDGKLIKFRKKLLLNIVGFPMSMLPLAVTYMTTDRAGNIDNVVFSFNINDFDFTWTEGDEKNTIPVGLDGRYRYGTMRLGQIDYKVCCDAVWTEKNRLLMNVRPIETIGKRTLDFCFYENGKVTFKPSSTPSVVTILENLTPGFVKMINNEAITDRLIPLFRYADKLIEPVHKGRIRKK